ncbi:ribonuclease P protein component [Streptomyces caniscabiei]|uniref:ribonuclease P protein component n=1 Tax=Streptomyces caniscabiei TaxID=2746961 RepID=UPI0029AAFE51|nr:ribonuclease P protein component [Streptomyces caniscabiei]MDX2776398.1 ribonuclease P protein component [Streptomyces caniscabiei]
MLSSEHRFHGHGSLRYVYKNGHAIRSHLITIKHVTNPHRKTSRFSVVVSKKVHKGAVGRNRIRRRIYELVRHEIPHMTGVHDVAIMVFSNEVMTMPHDELKQVLVQLFDQAGLYK